MVIIFKEGFRYQVKGGKWEREIITSSTNVKNIRNAECWKNRPCHAGNADYTKAPLKYIPTCLAIDLDIFDPDNI